MAHQKVCKQGRDDKGKYTKPHLCIFLTLEGGNSYIIAVVHKLPTVLHIASLLSQTTVDIAEGFLDGSVINYTFTYNDGSGSPPTFVVPSADCSGGVCEHFFNVPTSSTPTSYTVSVTATNVVGEGPANTSQPISEYRFFMGPLQF